MLNEYLDKNFGLPLRDYLKNSNDETKMKSMIYRYGNCAKVFMKYLDSIGEYYDAENIEELSDEGELSDEIAEGVYSKYLKGFYEWLMMVCTPTTDNVMDYDRTVYNGWLVHFSNNAYEIWREGFRYATYDFDELGYSGAGNIRNKDSEGFCFAYDANNIPNDGDKYGKNAILFMASGVKAFHLDDDEYQVMFWNNSARNLICIENYYGDWCVRSDNDRVMYRSGKIQDVVDWCIDNFRQYQRVLLNPRESRIKDQAMKKSEYTYDWRKSCEKSQNIVNETILDRIIGNVITEALNQKYGSSATSINRNKTASGFPFFGGTTVDRKTGKPKWNEPVWKKGMVNVDIGGGKFDNAHDYLNSNFGATNLVFDPFSRDAAHNGEVFDRVEANGGADTVTCFNCLNVIREPEVRDNVILQCSQVLKPEGRAFFQVYSDAKKLANGGARAMGNDQWQEFRDISTYIPEIEKHFGSVVKKGQYLIASHPLDSNADAEWSLDSTGQNVRKMKRFRTKSEETTEMNETIGKVKSLIERIER